MTTPAQAREAQPQEPAAPAQEPVGETTEMPYRATMLARALSGLTIAAALAVGIWYLVITLHGGHVFMVETPSMARTAPVGTLVVTEPVANQDVHVGDIISFRPPGIDRVYTHRIVEATAHGFRTKGDLNAAPDGWVVPASRIVGRAVHLWTGVGWLVRMLPWLVLGGLVTAVWRRFVKPRNRAAVIIAGASLSMSLALIIVRPLVRAETIGFVPVGTDGVKISAVSTGLLPIRATALDGGFTDLVAGQLGWVETHKTDSHGRFQLLPTLHLTWWGWVLMALFCALPLIASLFIRPEEIDDEAASDGEAGPDQSLRPGSGVGSMDTERSASARAARIWGRAPGKVAHAATALVSVVVLAVAVSPTQAALTAKVTNSTDTVRTRSFFTCLDAMRYYRPDTGTLTLIAGFAGGDGTGVPGTTGQSVHTTDTLSPTSTTATTNVGCVSDANKRSQQALTLNGTSSKLDVSSPPSVSLVNSQPQNGNRMTIMTWFRTTGSGGVLGCLAQSSAKCSGRTLYMGASGKVYFANDNSTTIASPSALNDGVWHFAIGQLDSDTGTKLWIDGVLVASNASATASDGNIVYPQFGYSSSPLPTAYPDKPASPYFAGSMQFFGVYGGYSGRTFTTAEAYAMYEAARP